MELSQLNTMPDLNWVLNQGKKRYKEIDKDTENFDTGFGLVDSIS